MKILVLENLVRQTNLFGEYGRRPVSKEGLKLIFNELDHLIQLNHDGGVQSLNAYLKRQHGRELHGAADYVWKYELSDGVRIMYTWGSYLPYIAEEDKQSLVLLAYLTHDAQYHVHGKMPLAQRYEDATVLVKARSEFNLEDDSFIEEYETFFDIVFDPSYQANHAIYVVDDETLANADLKYLDFKLSEKQGEIIETYKENSQPTLILGGAGTGKTVLAVHFLNDFSASNNSAYFTQSKELLNSVKNRFNALSKQDDVSSVNFFDINEFCRSKLDSEVWSRKNFVETTQFLRLFVNGNKDVLHALDQCNLTPIDLWTEIRGVIKGSTGADWTRRKPFDQRKISCDNRLTFRELDRSGFIVRNAKDPQLFELTPDYVTRDYSDLSNDAVSLLNVLITESQKFDSNIKELSEDEYVALDEQVSMVEKESRKKIYSCYTKYKQWLEVNHFYDDNDLSLAVIGRLNDFSDKLFDFVVVDEIQDYTEIQIYLIQLLVKDTRGIVFAGDSKQIVNPTVFNERKLNQLFRDDNKRIKLNTVYLDQNFRCQREIVSLANMVAETRKSRIGAQKHDVIEFGLRDGEKPMILPYSKENVNQLVRELLRFPGVAVLVPTESVREKLIENFGKEEYKKAENSIIYTIAEIKGMEYRYVVSFDILSEFKEMWDTIMSGNASKKTRYRYYFNLFYVSITRAQEYLCAVESCEVNKFFSQLSVRDDLLQKIERYDFRKLFLDKLSNEDVDWLSDAEDNEEAGKYERAIESYRKANADISNIWRCTAKLAEQNRDYDACVKNLLLVDDGDLKINKNDCLNLFVKELDQSSSLWKLASAYLNPELFSENIADLNGLLQELYGSSTDNREYMVVLNGFVERSNVYVNSLLKV